MPDLHIHRFHQLGLERARALAQEWAQKAEQKFNAQCTWLPATRLQPETLHFKRSGIEGQVLIAADYFELSAQLGFLLKAMRPVIEAAIEKNLDQKLLKLV
jgi:putative polyhydroxyalkanoate system protein